MGERKSLYDSIRGIAIIGIMSVHLFSAGKIAEVNNSLIGNIMAAGLLGVEITYFLNAFFLAQSYEKVLSGRIKAYELVKKSIKRIMPYTYFMIIVLCVTNYRVKGNIDISIPKLLAHIFFVNGFSSYSFNSNLGLGYVGILVLMWIVYPIYLKYVNDEEKPLSMQ